MCLGSSENTEVVVVVVRGRAAADHEVGLLRAHSISIFELRSTSFRKILVFI